MHKGAVNIHTQVVWEYVSAHLIEYLQWLGCVARLRFSFVRNGRSVFRSGHTILRSQQQCKSVPVAPHSHQHVVVSVPGISAIPTGIQRDLRVSIGPSLLTNDESLLGASVHFLWQSSDLVSFSIGLFLFLLRILYIFKP